VWLAASRVQHAYLGTRCVAFTDASHVLQWRDVSSFEEGLQAVAQGMAATAATRRAAVKLWLSGALARPFLVEPVPGLRGWREAQRVAMGLAPDATGLAGPCSVWLDDGLPAHGVLAVAVDQSTLRSIETQLERESGMRIASMRPWWAHALDGALTSDADRRLLVVEEPDAWTLLGGVGAEFSLASTCWPLPEHDQAMGWVRRSLLGAAMTSEGGLCARFSRDAMASRTGVPNAELLPMTPEVFR